MKVIDRFLRAIFVASFLIVPTSFCLSMAQVGAESEVPETLEGVWTLREKTPYYVANLQDRPAPIISISFAVLVNPHIEGDRVYREDGETFFFKDQLKKAEAPVYKVLPGSVSYRDYGDSANMDPYDWDSHRGGTFPYLMDTTLRLKEGHLDKVYLTNDEVPVDWIKDGNWAHFFARADLVLLNPNCLPEVIPEGKLKE